jgi:Uma2 family endonuclease
MDGDVIILPASGPGSLYRLSVEQYRRIAEQGIIREGAPVELLEGLLVNKKAKTPPHNCATGMLHEELFWLVPRDEYYVAQYNPVTAADSEPEPDLQIVRGGPRDYLRRFPGPSDVPLVVEASDASLDEDRGRKKRIYARAGIPAYWIVNLVTRLLEVHDDPTGPADAPDYRNRRELGPDDEVPVVLDGREVGRIAVGDILP